MQEARTPQTASIPSAVSHDHMCSAEQRARPHSPNQSCWKHQGSSKGLCRHNSLSPLCKETQHTSRSGPSRHLAQCRRAVAEGCSSIGARFPASCTNLLSSSETAAVTMLVLVLWCHPPGDTPVLSGTNVV
jgi:hypothetical protein